MCGICGFNWNDKELVTAMANEIAHRGPDQRGIFCLDEISLGHMRLSIIDLSEHGRQPMSNEDGSIHLVFNGEIYNFQELRKDLLDKGHHFISRSDSEVIIHNYEEYGLDAIHKLRGMFAFAIWDANRKSLLIVRDRIGIKPLYYYYKDGKLVFASEIKAILKDKTIERKLNHQALYDYIGFEFVPSPQTMFQNIFKVPAGHYLMLKDGQVELKKYWDLSFERNINSLSYEDAVGRLVELFEHAVKSHLVSDVPIGVFLSGGLDSSAIVAMMRRNISGPLRTFTIGYPDKTFSELDYAQQVADCFETEHHVLMIEELKPDHIEKALWHFDEPITDFSAIPLLLLCEKAKVHAIVCLSGEGGDESFAGYDRFKASSMERFYRAIPSFVRKHIIERLVESIPDQPQKKGAINELKRFIEGVNLRPEGQHLRWQYFGNSKQDSLLFNKEFRNVVAFDPFRQVREYSARCDAADRINREIFLDLQFMMTDSVLMKVDKMSMASSIEIRVPFLDHVFVEFMASLPGNWKLKGLRTKHIFRSAFKGILPDTIINRGKQGYGLPVKHLLRDQLKQYMIDLLNESPIIRQNMDPNYVNHLIHEHLKMTKNNNHVLWSLMNVAIWHNKFLK